MEGQRSAPVLPVEEPEQKALAGCLWTWGWGREGGARSLKNNERIRKME